MPRKHKYGENKTTRIMMETVHYVISGAGGTKFQDAWFFVRHNKELNDLYSSPNIVRVIKLRMRWMGHVARIGERRGAYRVLVWKPEGKRPL